MGRREGGREEGGEGGKEGREGGEGGGGGGRERKGGRGGEWEGGESKGGGKKRGGGKGGKIAVEEVIFLVQHLFSLQIMHTTLACMHMKHIVFLEINGPPNAVDTLLLNHGPNYQIPRIPTAIRATLGGLS
jgi:hypothetical protein